MEKHGFGRLILFHLDNVKSRLSRACIKVEEDPFLEELGAREIRLFPRKICRELGRFSKDFWSTYL